MKKSTTILLPQWYSTLDSCDLPHRMMPRDVSTRWNSTFDMLHFALEYRDAIDTMTAKRDLDLRKYELSPAEWGIAKELRDVLKVCLRFFLFFFFIVKLSCRYLRTRRSSFLVEPQILPLSFRQWTISTKSLPPRPCLTVPISSLSPSVLLYSSGRTRSTGTTTRQTTLKFTVLP